MKQQLKVTEYELEQVKNKYHFWKYKYLRQLKKNVSDISLKIDELIQGTIFEKFDNNTEISNLCLKNDWLLYGTSFATPVRAAKLALNDMMKNII